MHVENWPLVTDEVQDFRKITDHIRGIYGVYLRFVKEKLKDANM
jgi:hypothetical protein